MGIFNSFCTQVGTPSFKFSLIIIANHAFGAISKVPLILSTIILKRIDVLLALSKS